MFDLFNREPGIKITDKITLSQNAKWENCLREWKENKSLVFIAWFNDTADAYKDYVLANATGQPEIYVAHEMRFMELRDRAVIFLEHHPLHNKEVPLFEKLHLKEVVVYSSLDEPLLLYAGAEKLQGMMQSLGMKENEVLQHNMISRSIIQLQKKFAAKITLEQSARSQQQWINANVH